MLSSSRKRTRHDPSYGITTAESSQLDDIARRQRQYAFTMLFRIVAILVVVFVPGLTVMERVLLGIVATVIPYFAVIRANAGPDTAADPTNLMIGAPQQVALPGPDRSLEGRTPYLDPEDFDTDDFDTDESDDEDDPDPERPHGFPHFDRFDRADESDESDETPEAGATQETDEAAEPDDADESEGVPESFGARESGRDRDGDAQGVSGL
jgi:Protein of unknown function (DUF3099)